MDNATIAQRIREQCAEIHSATQGGGTTNFEQVAKAKAALDALADELHKEQQDAEAKKTPAASQAPGVVLNPGTNAGP